VHEIKEDDLTVVNRSYILQDYSGKEADIVYRLRLRGDKVIFYILGTAVYSRSHHALQAAAVHGRDLAGYLQKHPEKRTAPQRIPVAGHHSRCTLQQRRRLDSVQKLPRIPNRTREINCYHKYALYSITAGSPNS